MKQEKHPEHRLHGKEPHIISLIILSAFASMGAVLMAPALPAIAAYFQVSDGTAQLTVTSFLLGYAFGQLFYGPIANRYGRKKAFYIGIAISTVGSLFSIMSAPVESFNLLIVGRLLEALGSSVGLVVCFTVINDFYLPSKGRKVTALMSLAFAVVPAVAVAIGGILVNYLGWQSCFYFLLLYGLVLIIPALSLPETLMEKDLYALNPTRILKSYKGVIQSRKLILYSVIFGLSASCAYLFAAEGPIIGIHILGFNASVYGLLGMIPFMGSVVGSLTSARWGHRVSAIRFVWFAYGCEVLGSVLMLVVFLLGYVNIYTLLGPMILIALGHAVLTSNVTGLAMMQTEDKSHGSAVMNFLCMFMTVVMTFILGMAHVKAAWILPVLLVVTLCLMTLCLWRSKRVS